MPKKKQKTLKILGKKYNIEDMSTPENGPFGLCHLAESKIYINEVLSEDEYNDTILHEIIHAIDFAGRLNLKEKQVHSLSTLLYSVLTDNKLLRLESPIFSRGQDATKKRNAK